MPGWVPFPGVKIVQRPVVIKQWVTGGGSEDGEEWMEEVRAHCESCSRRQGQETSQVQEVRIQEQRRRGTVLRPGLGEGGDQMLTVSFEPG